ncbi:MAG: hypothetical protein AAF235_03220, partial [Planctomycetota bacterium]
SERAEAVTNIIRSIQDVDEAMLRIGDVLVAKATTAAGVRVVVETVSPSIQREMERNPQLARDPAKFIACVDRSQPGRGDDPPALPSSDVIRVPDDEPDSEFADDRE